VFSKSPMRTALYFVPASHSSVICRNVHCEPQCIASVRMWAGGCNLGLPSSSFALLS
jgi:hypothetical protein